MNAKKFSVVAVFLLLMSVAVPPRSEAVVLDHTAGVTFIGGGNYWTDPSGHFGDGFGFRGNSGGYSLGGGLYYELRVAKFVAFELGFSLEKTNLWRYIDVNVGGGAVEVIEQVEGWWLRVPLVLKGVLPVGFGRLSLGLGAEFVLPQSGSAFTQQDGFDAEYDKYIKSEQAGSTMLLMDLGFVFELPGPLELPFRMRFGKNMSQSGKWSERVSTAGGVYTVNHQNSWDLRLQLGLAYAF
jgi:hypothetical protein